MDIISNCNGQRQRRRLRADAFSVKKRQKFLDALALTCNVEEAAAYAGVHRTTPYVCRLRDPQFAAQWREALETGYDRLETLVLEHGGAGMPLEPADPHRVDDADPHAPPPFDFDRALTVLRFRQAERKQPGARGRGSVRRPATREETNAALIKAIAAAKKRLGMSSDA